MNQVVLRFQTLYSQGSEELSRTARRVPALGLLLDAWAAFSRDQMGTLAAALAYYLLLALFPILLLLIALASPFFASEEVIRQAVRFAGSYLPTIERDLPSLLIQAVRARGPASILATLGLFWSASGVFDVLQRGLDRAWHAPNPPPLWRQRLISLATVLVLGGLFALSFATSALARSGLRLRIGTGPGSIELVSSVFAIILNFLLFVLIYRVFPNVRLSLRQVWHGALIAAVLWEVAKYLFVWYLLNFARLNLIYGTVGLILALLIWGYITASILLFGAEVCALRTRRAAA